MIRNKIWDCNIPIIELFKDSVKDDISPDIRHISAIMYMWPNLTKATFHAHNIKTHFSPSNDTCSHWLTIQAGIHAESCLGCFFCGLFLRPVRCPWVLRSPSNCYIHIPFDKQTAGCNSPHGWLMSLAMDLDALCDMWWRKWHHWMPFSWSTCIGYTSI